jgi:hypothetical protein
MEELFEKGFGRVEGFDDDVGGHHRHPTFFGILLSFFHRAQSTQIRMYKW